MKIKKLITLLTLIVWVFSALNIVYADDGIENNEEIRGDFVYLKGTDTITAYIGESGVCEIPEGVRLSGNMAHHAAAKKAEKLIINKDVEKLFIMPVSGVKEVEFKEGVTEIPESALHNWEDNSIERIIFPSTLKEIGDYTFCNLPKLKTVEFPDGLESIGRESFQNLSSLSGDIIIPDSVTNMGYGVFSDCGDLDRVHLSENVTYTKDFPYTLEIYAMWFNNTNIKEINVPPTVIRDQNHLFHADEITFDGKMTEDIYRLVKNSGWCKNKFLKGVTDKSDGNKDFIMNDGVLYSYKGKDRNPVVPEGVKTIVGDAFHYLDIDTVTLPKSLEVIERSAFNCTTLREITIPENIKVIEEWAFDDCPLLGKAVFEGLPEEETWDIFPASCYLSKDYKDNIVYTKGETPEYLYSGSMMVDVRLFYEILNRFGGYNLTWENDYITTPSYDAEMLAAGNVPESMLPKKNDTENKEQTVSDDGKIDNNAGREQPSPLPSISNEQDNAAAEKSAPQTLSVKGGDTISVYIDGRSVHFPDAKPYVDDNGRTQIPVRAVAELLDCEVKWDSENKTVTITSRNGDIILLRIGSSELTANGITEQMDTSAIIKDERTYIPLRYAAEAMGLTVEWTE